MQEDLRYIENLIQYKPYSSHPNSLLLSQFIENKLTKEEREKVLEHIVHCQQCSETIALFLINKESIKKF